MAPDEEAEDRDRQAREGDERIAEDLLARDRRDDLADDAHAGQDHDVDGRVRVEPEQVLEQDRVAAELRIENAQTERALGHDEHERDGDHGRAENHDEAGRVVRPDEQRQPEPREARVRASGGSVTMKLKPVRIDENPATNAAIAAIVTLVCDALVLYGV